MPKKPHPSGTYFNTKFDGESVSAFVPNPLPPNPPINLGMIAPLLERANQSLGRLDGTSLLLPDTGLFLYMYVRKEAVLSAQIEGTQSSLSDLLLSEFGETPGVPFDDVIEVSDYVAALEYGLEKIRGGFPLSLRLLNEIHAILLASGRGKEKLPGELRRSQNWIGGARPGHARYVPPPPHLVLETMGALETFLHASHGLPRLIEAALAHVQFETIHPYLDGNGRLGRLLITLLLCDRGILAEPILYLSLYFKKQRDEYYRLLQSTRESNVWEPWIVFFLEGIIETADQAVIVARQLHTLFANDAAKILKIGRAAPTALRILEMVRKSPFVTIAQATKRLGVSHPTCASAIDKLIKNDILSEITGRQRDRIYVYSEYLRIMQTGTEPIK